MTRFTSSPFATYKFRFRTTPRFFNVNRVIIDAVWGARITTEQLYEVVPRYVGVPRFWTRMLEK